MDRVSKLPLAETHKLLTVPCISDTSCQQLVRQRLLLHGLQRPSMNWPLWCRLWHPKPVVYLRAKEWGYSRPGAFRPCEPDHLDPSLPECPLHWRRDWRHLCRVLCLNTRLGAYVCTQNHACPWHYLNCHTDRSEDCRVQSPVLLRPIHITRVSFFYTVKQKKLHPFIFAITLSNLLYWHTYTSINLAQNDIKITTVLWNAAYRYKWQKNVSYVT